MCIHVACNDHQDSVTNVTLVVFIAVLLHIQISVVYCVFVGIQQTVPVNNAAACPGDLVQFTCTAPDIGLAWLYNNTEVEYGDLTPCTSVNNFKFALTNDSQSLVTSTATSLNITSAEDNQVMTCISGGNVNQLTVNVQGWSLVW